MLQNWPNSVCGLITDNKLLSVRVLVNSAESSMTWPLGFDHVDLPADLLPAAHPILGQSSLKDRLHSKEC
jgi:hypothetical protein